MSMSEHHRGVWIWNLSKIRSDYLEQLDKCHVKRIYLKVFDGKRNQQQNPTFWDWQCSPQIVQSFKSRGIEVYGWGYHYGTSDVEQQVEKVKQALDCGLDGYVLDVEEEVKDESTHPYVEKLLLALRPLVKKGSLGYTSFGYPEFHRQIPWGILDKYCDIALPQIYFEKFSFRPTTQEKVEACLKAHKQLGLTKPILPIWGSEADANNPATAAELQNYLNQYSGSSIWRIPNTDERGEAWNLKYIPEDSNLPVPTSTLRRGSKGSDVETLQKLLNEKGFNAGQVDGDFGPQTEAAVRKFQTQARIEVDGIVGFQTWQALADKSTNPNNPNGTGLISLKNIPNKEIQGFFFPSDNPFAKTAISSNPKRWIGEPGQRARYLQDEDMPVVENPQVRSPEQIRQVIDYLNVADPQNKRYWPQGGETYCNIFARDVMRCLRAPLTHWVGRKEQGANEMYDWLNNPTNGWKSVSVNIAISSAAQGIPTLVCWKNPRGIGHIAVVRPEPGQPNNPRIAQAGARNFANNLMTEGFGSRKVGYFIYKN
ncbi:peptidoglycan-binding protein [Chrysosporum ovalisporum APH033B]|uniref:peptidoglycan-binding domain-containing protein n=1 Tax=Umezakia ovalisporum TaxID=75695 RepID=UPI0024753FB5|nr:peptidoglycan-binding domain-containing protein [Umezakia ovalisporum]MDH6068995.1 peptidoglycan-binding protein [Umezakia ovalisporum APH033B]